MDRACQDIGMADSSAKLTRDCGTVQVGISAMFEQAGCGTPAVRSLLGEGAVSEANMMQYLGILEQRTNEILQVSSCMQHLTCA